MIKFYCQYSYGGFKTFRINGEAHESLNQEVTTANTYEFPKLADLYFNQGGAKILYRYIDRDTLIFVVREIPSLGLDTDNRKISCAVQFIGNASDRALMDKLVIRVLNNLNKFESEFAEMFDLRGGLHFEGDKLAAIVNDCQSECRYEGESKLLQIPNRRGTVILFVPFSENFGTNPTITNKLLSELHLPEETIEPGRSMSYSELKRMQCLLEIHSEEANQNIDKKDTDNSMSDIEQLKLAIVEKEKEIKDKQQECAQLRKALSESIKEQERLKKEHEEWEEKGKKLFFIGCGILGASILINIIQLFK